MQSLPKLMTGFFKKCFCCATILIALFGCATDRASQRHAFSFDGWFDKWADTVDLLEFAYGDKYAMVKRTVAQDGGNVGYSWNVNGSMPIGEFLFVKWRLKSTGELFQNKVDLRGSLPVNMTDHRVTFVIDGRELFVYLVTPVPKARDDLPIFKTFESKYHVTRQIFPASQ
ncbi:hypothetical protein [Xylophilus sp. GOD-11R]|uniref:hypothetical protein n=1 Tax=Xylophilus sp. GOD-11R TaxID=3089814 RepID=UPI00298BF245|nr:hypothetical protein [Xylophilus sp. GOD-11R]WPB56480.1 hypothetical protein R9X41_20415 [Xylophilus sp. GOD-11R]